MREFDVVVLGAGAAGEVVAGRLGENGLSVAIVEDRLVGGECSFYAAMPSSAVVHVSAGRPGAYPARQRAIDARPARPRD
jgi:pyruvate/2-oxoglutarate dehydrogenase complex dihydrolipoamide dehydrogenase (E3) component